MPTAKNVGREAKGAWKSAQDCLEAHRGGSKNTAKREDYESNSRGGFQRISSGSDYAGLGYIYFPISCVGRVE